MDYDEKILLAFKKANQKGRKEISSEALLFLTDLPEHVLYEKLKALSKYGYIKQSKKIKEKVLWRLSSGR